MDCRDVAAIGCKVMWIRLGDPKGAKRAPSPDRAVPTPTGEGAGPSPAHDQRGRKRADPSPARPRAHFTRCMVACAFHTSYWCSTILVVMPCHISSDARLDRIVFVAPGCPGATDSSFCDTAQVPVLLRNGLKCHVVPVSTSLNGSPFLSSFL